MQWPLFVDVMILLLLIVLFAAALVVAAIYDCFTMTIPNQISLGCALLTPVAALVSGAGAVEFMWHFVVALLVLVVCFGFFAMGWIGGGDAKLAAGVAFWFGPDLVMSWLVMTAAFGGVLTLLILTVRKYPLPQVLHDQDWALRLHDMKTGVPYGIAISAGALWVLPMSHWVKALSWS